jgi:RNA polymerase subunit RPABC4/transcription elongation factor Spt4
MATTTGKTLLFVLLLLVFGLTFYGPLFFLIMLPFRVMLGAVMRFPDFSSHFPGVFFLDGRMLGLLFFAIWILWILVAIWAYSDAERRGMNGILWGLLVFVGNVIGLIVYLLVRLGQKTGDIVAQSSSCPNCGKPIQADFRVCPYCQTALVPLCSSCAKPVLPDWQVCPYCQTQLK